MTNTRILREWDELGYDESVMNMVFHENAERLLGLRLAADVHRRSAQRRATCGG